MIRIGRNQPCPCGSGKKYKKCCYQKNNVSDRIPSLKGFSENLPKGAVTSTISKKEKMSEVLLKFANPLTDECEDDKAINNALQISVIAWNASFFPPKERNKLIEESINKYISDKNEREIAKAILLKMLRRKEEDFPNIERIIVDFQISYRDGHKQLDVVSTPINK